MSFSDIFIRRPVLATVVALMIILLGLQGIAQLTVREYPKVDETVITVTTNYAGASADLIQGFITAPIAEAVATTENIDYVTSSSRPSSSTVTVQMKLGANPDAALTEVIAKVNQVRGDLPDESDDPVIVKGTGQNFATMYLAAQNPNMTSEQITEYLERVIQPRMSTIQGVAKAENSGRSGLFDACLARPDPACSTSDHGTGSSGGNQRFQLPVGARHDQERICVVIDHIEVDLADTGSLWRHADQGFG